MWDTFFLCGQSARLEVVSMKRPLVIAALAHKAWVWMCGWGLVGFNLGSPVLLSMRLFPDIIQHFEGGTCFKSCSHLLLSSVIVLEFDRVFWICGANLRHAASLESLIITSGKRLWHSAVAFQPPTIPPSTLQWRGTLPCPPPLAKVDHCEHSCPYLFSSLYWWFPRKNKVSTIRSCANANTSVRNQVFTVMFLFFVFFSVLSEMHSKLNFIWHGVILLP